MSKNIKNIFLSSFQGKKYVFCSEFPTLNFPKKWLYFIQGLKRQEKSAKIK